MVVGAARTAIGSFGGNYKFTPAHVLGAIAVRESVRRSGLHLDAVDEVIMGEVSVGVQASRLNGSDWIPDRSPRQYPMGSRASRTRSSNRCDGSEGFSDGQVAPAVSKGFSGS